MMSATLVSNSSSPSFTTNSPPQAQAPRPPVQDLGQRVIVHWDRGIDVGSAGLHITMVLKKIWGAERQLQTKQTTLANRRESISLPANRAQILVQQSLNETKKWKEILHRYELELDNLVFKKFQLVRVRAQAGQHVPQGAGRLYTKAPGFTLPKVVKPDSTGELADDPGFTQINMDEAMIMPVAELGEQQPLAIALEQAVDQMQSPGPEALAPTGTTVEELPPPEQLFISEPESDPDEAPRKTCLVCGIEHIEYQYTKVKPRANAQNAVIVFDGNSSRQAICLLCLGNLWDHYGPAVAQLA